MAPRSSGTFKLHAGYMMAEDCRADEEAPLMQQPLLLLASLQAKAFGSCFCELYRGSRRFAGVRYLSFRGCDSTVVTKRQLNSVIDSCTRLTHVDFSFMHEQVEDKTLNALADRHGSTLVSLKIRSCSLITDAGVIGLCERLSGYHKLKVSKLGAHELDEEGRINFYLRNQAQHENKSQLQYLDLSELP